MPLFISYSHQNKDFVDKLARQLVAQNVHVWLDRWELNIGDSLLDKIQAAIEGASALLVILSKSSVMSAWCNKELSSGLLLELEKKKVFVLPVLLEDCDIPLFLRGKLYADFRTNFDDGLRTILEGVSKITNPNLAREKEVSWHTDLAVDWRDMPDNSFLIRLTYVEQAQGQPYCVLTTIEIVCSPKVAEIYQPNSPTNEGVEGRLYILEAILTGLEMESDIRPRLSDQFEKTVVRTVDGKKRGEMYFVKISVRRLGEDTGGDILTNSTNLVRQTVEHMHKVLRRS